MGKFSGGLSLLACLLLPAVLFAGILRKSCDEFPNNLAFLETVSPSPYTKDYQSHWVHAQNETAIALVVPGLNNRTSAMNGVVQYLRERNISSLVLALDGQRGDIEEMKHVRPEDWQKSFYYAYCQARNRAEEVNEKIVYVGYSLSGLVMVDSVLQDTETAIQFDKQILFVPALHPRPITRLVELFGIFGKDFIVNGLTPERYRAYPGTSMAAYEALFRDVDFVKKTSWPSSLNVPTNIFISPKDELVQLEGVEKLLDQKGMTNWQIELVKKRGDWTEPYNHLIIDRASAGNLEWKRIERLMDEVLGVQLDDPQVRYSSEWEYTGPALIGPACGFFENNRVKVRAASQAVQDCEQSTHQKCQVFEYDMNSREGSDGILYRDYRSRGYCRARAYARPQTAHKS